MRLPSPIDVVAHVRRIEGMLIEVCAHFGLTAVQVKGRGGVWVPADGKGPDRKVTAIGIRVSEGVTIRDIWDGPMIVKGSQSVEDAQRMVDVGADAIVLRTTVGDRSTWGTSLSSCYRTWRQLSANRSSSISTAAS